MSPSTVALHSGYWLRVRRQSEWELLPRESLRASFEISIGNRKCTGAFLEAQVEWARTRFGTFEFSVGDTLNVHNYMAIGHPDSGVLPAEEARAVARSEGDQWLAKNFDMINRLLPAQSFRIMRWDSWMEIQDIQENILLLESLCRSNVHFDEHITSESMQYAHRRHVSRISSEAIISLKRYIVEELAVFLFQAQSTSCVHLYPGSDLRVFRQLEHSDLLPVPLRSRHFALFEIGRS